MDLQWFSFLNCAAFSHSGRAIKAHPLVSRKGLFLLLPLVVGQGMYRSHKSPFDILEQCPFLLNFHKTSEKNAILLRSRVTYFILQVFRKIMTLSINAVV